jgi:hypothetical protein
VQGNAEQCNREHTIQCRTMHTNAGQSTSKTVLGAAEKRCITRHAPAMQLLAIANAVVTAIVIVVALSAVFIAAVAALFMSGV